MSRHRRSRSSRQERYEQESPQVSNHAQGGFNLANLAGIINSIDINQLAQSINEAGDLIEEQEERGIRTAPNADIIMALRTLINADKAMLLQTFIQLLASSRNQKK
ncbi:MAG: hypothetical protein GX895_10750 [Clostridiales bacterium]|uniref:hypothetical protein n=1 Tax=Clostridium sp. N3C TaxID=1776758 RepID=UPI00092E0837|nr:hypothetical protein [Clostridium sp. N3C]NLZ49233.1 hypothetical protein [Clostridiales bacterium]SCN24768.1 hypothetical protein N3C_1968 [Clostridium sp. N3C]